jgi:Big-like domain-containing protein/carboxypeptidase family protein/IPT/TIG domain-containing protein/beta-propeller repeat-containing protein
MLKRLLTIKRAYHGTALMLIAAIWFASVLTLSFEHVSAETPKSEILSSHGPANEVSSSEIAPGLVHPERDSNPNVPAESRSNKLLGLPLSFQANEGQTDAQVKYLSRGKGYNLFLTPTAAVLSLQKAGPSNSLKAGAIKPTAPSRKISSSPLKVSFVGANSQAHISGLEELPGKNNYFIGNDPRKWRTDVPTYGKVKYSEIYPGIDLIYYGKQQQLEFDFVIAPKADAGQIELRFDGIKGMRVDDNGDLVLRVAGGELRQHKPISYQESPAGRQPVSSRYVIVGKHRVAIRVGTYDKQRPLIIDPTLSYSTFIGGTGGDEALGIALDSSNNIYVSGGTTSLDFPTANAYQPTSQGGNTDGYPEIFIFKLNAAGTALIYSTYLGGSDSDHCSAPAIDSSGNVYLTGRTYSLDFPLVNPLQPIRGGGSTDAFVTKIGSAGNSLIYSTYLGGSAPNNVERGRVIKADLAGNAYVAGITNSSNFPTTPNCYQPNLSAPGVNDDVWITKINPTGTALIYSTYLGGSSSEDPVSLAINDAGNVYVGGSSGSANFPILNGAQTTYGGGWDGFITKLNTTGTALEYSTFIGGNDFDVVAAIALDPAGNVYIAGATMSSNFPTVNPFQSVFSGGSDIFGNIYADAIAAKLNSTGSAFLYSTYIGGNQSDSARAIAVDASGNAYLAGFSSSTNFPKVFPLQSAVGGMTDVILVKLRPTGSSLAFSTYLGGTSNDWANGVALDSDGNALLAGLSCSSNFPLVNPLFTSNGTCDAIVTKISGLATYVISGRVTDANGQGLSSVTMTLSGSSSSTVQSDSSGNYSFPNLPAGGNFTITPTKSPYTFVPTNRTFNNLSADQTANFTVSTYTVSGRVTNSAATPISGVTIALSGTQSNSTQTDASGNYSFSAVAAGGNYTVTPSKPDALLTYSFNPTSRNITNLSANTSLIDFTASVSIVTTVNPIADAYVQDGSAANTNFGTATTMLVRTDNQTNNGLNRDAYLMFDVDGVSGSISSVKLRFFAAVSTGSSVTTGAYQVTSTTWKESGSGSITWNNKPARQSLLASVAVSGTTFATYDIDVTNYVRGEKLAGRNRVSLALHDPSPVTPHFTVNSREAAANKPRLIVTTSATGNSAPAVSISNPQAGANFTAPASIQISSNATDSDGTISSVSYYAGTQAIGTSTTSPSYQITWPGVAAGTYALFAVATDNVGATTTSSPITVDVNPTNNPPAVSIDSPLEGTIFSAGSNIALRAKPADTDGSINKVEFFAGSTLVGTATTPDGDNLYSVTWNNVNSGAYALTAKATDNANGVTPSAIVNISVVSQTGLASVFDAYVRDGASASTNFGPAADLQVQSSATAGSNRESHFRFDLTAVSGIARAKLRLYGKLSDTSGANVPLGAYAVSDTTWTETGITWNNKPATGTLLSSTTITDNVARWYEFDVTSHVKGEKELNHNAVSLAVKALANSSPFATFNSKEANLATDIRPQLIIWTTQARNALLVVGSSNLGAGDNAVKTRLQNLGYTVTVKVANNSLLSTDADGKTVIVVSSTVTANNVGSKFRHTSVPIVNWEFDIFDDMGMTGTVLNTDFGTTASTQNLNIINSSHPLAAGLALGQQQVVTTGTALTWGNPTSNAAKIAWVTDTNKIVIFGYDAGVAMTSLNAPGRRVGLFMTDLTANSFNTNGGALFDAAIKWATELITMPVINSVTPTMGPVGTTVTVTGINFGTTQGSSTLKFNGVAASPTSWTDKTIVSSVPLFASTGPIVVTMSGVASNGLVFAVGGIDSDADGLPDTWEIQYFGNLNQTATGDPDGDGLTNLQEYQQGRNPTKSALSDPGDFVNLKVHTPLSP